MTAPNIAGLTTVTGKTNLDELVSSSATTLVSCASSSNKVVKVNSIIVSNEDGTNAADVTVIFNTSGDNTDYYLAKAISVPAKTTLVVLSKDTQLYLEEGDLIKAQASADGDLQAITSYEEIS